ncbi:MAG: 50S ribosomal protein L16 [Candidatus Aenigmatarchaeota archaeon]|nr:50S ribosomal protein L16 [Candidatus Aenigmarchaeota archaeon]
MPIRPMRCYHHIKKKPYTRISKRKPRKSYVKGVPASKIHHFETGNVSGNFPLKYAIIPSVPVQIRSNSLEAARTIATKYLSKNFGDSGFFLKILVYPHHVLRENALATGAGADRYSEGMRHSFGKPIGQAARVDPGQKIMVASVPEGKDEIVKEALRRASSKLPGACKIIKC